MTRTLRHTFVQAVLAAGLCGCAHVPVGQDDLSYPERQSYLQQLDGWDMRGRIAVDMGEQAFQGSFRWQQSVDSLDLVVRGPLGGGVLQVAGPPDRLMVRARGETWELVNPETELSALLGWWLPVRSFSAWLLGLPDPMFAAQTSFGPDDTLQSLEQRLWTLSFQSYQLLDSVALPRRIDLIHRDLELRVTVDRWQSVADE
ncbi:MAG: lipoprotein insertase outer membrane protein LolB [Gammaproteobacteria bacterium]